MTIHEYLLLLRRRWWLLVSTAAVGIALALLWTSATPRTYVSGATVVVTASSAEGVSSSADLQRVGTLAALAGTDAILDPAAKAIGTTADVLRGSVGASARSGTTLIDVQSSAGTAEDAAQQANAVADALVNGASQASGSSGTVTLDVVTRAEVPSAPTSPRPRSNLVIGAVIGLALGVGVVLLVQSLDSRIRSTADLPRGPRFGSVTSLPSQRSRLTRSGGRSDPRLESFRQLRANLQFGSSVEGTVTVAGVSGSSATADVARQLGHVLGEIGVRVVVVDMDFRARGSRRAHKDGSATDSPGVSDVLTGKAALSEVELEGDAEGVRMISVGRSADRAAPLLSTTAMGDFLADLRSRYDFVLLVCPPVLERSETSVVAAQSGSSLLIVEAGRTKRSDLQQALELLGAVGSGPVSLVIDGATWRATSNLHPADSPAEA